MGSQTRYDPITSGKFTGTLLDVDGTAIPTANLDALTLTLTNARTGATINSRSAQNVLNANNVTVNSTTGALTWLIQPEDTTMEDTSESWEDHIAKFDWTYETTKKGTHTHRMHIVNYLSLCTIEDVKLLFDSFPTNDEPIIEMLIETFSQRAEIETERKFRKSTAASPTVETFSPKQGKWHYRTERFPIDSITSIKQAIDGNYNSGETLESDDYTFDSESGLVKMRWTSFMEGENSVQITYAGGLALDVGAVPMDLRWAAARQVSYWYQRRKMPGVVEVQVSRHGKESIMNPMDLLPEVYATLENYKPVYI